MRCPKCGSDESYVVDTRPVPDGLRRRRQCASCACRYSTRELTATALAEREGVAAQRAASLVRTMRW